MKTDAANAGEHTWPQTRRDDVVDEIQGIKVADPYRWLEAGDDPEVQKWTDAQDRFARGELAKLPELASTTTLLRPIYDRDELGTPQPRHGRLFYDRRSAGSDRSVLAWKSGETGEERVGLDPNTWPSSQTLSDWYPSPDGRLVAYMTADNNADEEVLRVRDVDANADLPDTIGGLKWSTPSWTPDGKGFYYRWLPAKGTVPETERRGHAELRFHALGTDAKDDAVMHPATGDVESHLDGFVSHDGRWLFATSDHGWTSSTIYVRDLRDKHGTWRTLIDGVDAWFNVVPYGNRFYIRTNDGASRYRVMSATPSTLARKAWTEVVPERPDATLQQLQIVGGKLVLTYLHDAATQIAIHDLDGTFIRNVDLPPNGTAEGITGTPDDDVGYISYSSFTEPGVVWKIALAAGTLTEVSRIKLPVDTSAYVTDQVWFPSKDGTKVSMFIVHKRDVVPGGRYPVVLFGYGGFGDSVTPQFSGMKIPIIEAGGVYAVANLRGGGEYGEPWHSAAIAEHKQVTVDDLRAAAHYLVDAGWAAPQRLGLLGGSNGGLMVAAAMNQEPALFRAVVSLSPLTDMVRYAQFGHASAWIPEYGSPDNPVQFAALRAISPYHNVVAGTAYPALLVTVGDRDDRVDPLHGRKLVAAVQAATSSDAPVLLYVLKGIGHKASDARDQQVEFASAVNAFLLSRLR